MHIGKYVNIHVNLSAIPINVVASLIDLVGLYAIAEVACGLFLHIVGSLGVRDNFVSLSDLVAGPHVEEWLFATSDLAGEAEIFAFEILHVEAGFVFLLDQRDFVVWDHLFHFEVFLCGIFV